MMTYRSVCAAFAVSGLVALAACGGAEETSAGPDAAPAGAEPEATTADTPAAAPFDDAAAPEPVADAPTDTAGEEVNAVTEACATGTNMSEAVCACIGRKASELSQTAQQFVAASLREDTATAEGLRSELGVQGAIKASGFLVNAPKDCAADGAQ